jgi:hypothetical protein
MAPAKRQAVGKDVAIGIGIAAVVLTLVAVGRFVVFKDDAAPAAAVASGGLVVVTGDDRPADVYLDDQRRGIAEGGRLELAALDAGRHRLRVVRDGAEPCERTIDVAAGTIETVRCELVAVAGSAPPGVVPPVPAPAEVPAAAAAADAGVDASDDDDRMTIHEDGPDDRDDAKPTPPPSPPPSPTPSPSPSQTPSQTPPPTPAPTQVADAGVRPAPRVPRQVPAPTAEPAAEIAAEPGFLVVSTRPLARVFIDGSDSGKTTPIAPARRLSLPPGKHSLTFVIGAESETYTVTISSGKTTRFSRDLQIGRGGP